jgi:serine protease Do
MKQLIAKISFVVLAAGFMVPVSVQAQDEKDKVVKDKKEGEQIIITRKNAKDDKLVITIEGDKVLLNGQPIKDDEGDVTVRRHKIGDTWIFGDGLAGNWSDNFSLLNAGENRALLGVTTEKDAKGAEIQTISKGGGAEKAGLQKKDIITRIDDKKIESPDDLSKTIRSHKPGDKVTVTFLRDGKEQKVTAELGKYKGVNMRSYSPGQQYYKMEIPELHFDQMPRVQTIPRIQGQNWSWSGGGPKLGLFVQDTEDGKGVKVVDVDEDGNASKAGIKEEDVITEIEGKTVNSADEVVKVVKESKDKTSINVKLLRKGKTENVQIKIPRKLKTADL